MSPVDSAEAQLDERAERRRRLISILISSLLFLGFLEVFAERQLGGTSVAKDYQSFYIAGYVARTNPHHLYDLLEQTRIQNARVAPGSLALPYFHPAYEALFYAPLSLLPYSFSYQVAIGINVLLLALVAALLPELATKRIPLLARYPGIALFTFAPVLITALQGQDSILFLLLCCLLWRAFQRGNNFIAGCILGLMLFRFQLALPLAAILVVRRGRPLLQGFLLTSSAVSVVSFAMIGWSGLTAWIGLLSSSSLLHNQGLTVQNSMAIHPLAMPNLFGLLYVAGAHVLAGQQWNALVLAASAGAFLWTAWTSRHLTRDSDMFAAALTCSLLVSYHMYLHDLSVLVLPLALLRTRVAFCLGIITYAGSFALVLYVGSERFFLLAIPVALLLWHGWMRPQGRRYACKAVYIPERLS